MAGSAGAPLGWLAGGCHPNRDVVAAIAAARFRVLELDRFDFQIMPPLVRPHVLGVAQRPTHPGFAEQAEGESGMNVLVTGASGGIGRQAIPRLLEAGHEVAGLARSAAAASWLRAAGATPVQVALFDPAMVAAAVVTDADAVVHLATAIPPLARMRRPGAWRTNDRLRTHPTGNLVDAASAAGVEVVAQESIGFNDAHGGTGWLDESAAGGAAHGPPVWPGLGLGRAGGPGLGSAGGRG